MADHELSSMDDGADGADDDVGAEWSSLREMIGAARASGFDEEPSPRIDALLMAAARAHAPRPRVAWWSRLASWMRPMVVHPALAGAAALVIVGGAAGVMYKRGQLSVGPPRLERTVAEKRQPPSPDPRTAPKGAADEAPPPVEPALPTTMPSGVPHEVMQPEIPKPQPGVRRPQRDRGMAPGGAAVAVADGFEAGAGGAGLDTLVIAADGESGPAWDSRKNATPQDDDRAGEDQVEREKNAKATVADSFSARVGGVAPAGAAQLRQLEETKAPPPPPPPPQEPSTADESPENRSANRRDSSGGAVGTAGAGDGGRAEHNRTQAAQLLGQARTASRSGHCATVRTIGDRVRKLDAIYYRDVFARDADVAKCK